MPRRDTRALVQNMGAEPDEPIHQGAGVAGFGRQDAPPADVSVNENVHVSPDKAYTFRLNIATMHEFEAWCKARKLGKGPTIAAALREYMARHGGE